MPECQNASGRTTELPVEHEWTPDQERMYKRNYHQCPKQKHKSFFFFSIFFKSLLNPSSETKDISRCISKSRSSLNSMYKCTR